MTHLDPRVEAAVKVIGPTLHGWHDGFAEGECPECQDVARDALAAADAVDPLRDVDKLTALVARGIADRWPPEPREPADLVEAKLVLAAIRKGNAR